MPFREETIEGIISLQLLLSRKGGQCFVAGTLIAAENGLIEIEHIQAGDLVWASDQETGETALKQVVRTFKNESEELVHLSINGEDIVTTPGHPFYVPVKGWTKAIQLRAGDILVTSNGEYVVLEKVQHEILEAPVFVYNFEVEDYHTYYVGTESVLVYNRCKNHFPQEGTKNSTSLRFDSDGSIHSAATYGSDGKILARIDLKGTAHYIKSISKSKIPHVHPFANNNGFLRVQPAITLEEFLLSYNGG